jgi:hypothetical protein
VTTRDAWLQTKETAKQNNELRIMNKESLFTNPTSQILNPIYSDITMPKNTAMGIYISGFAFLIGFAFVWQIIWLGIVGLIGVITCIIIRSLDTETEYIISASEVARMENARQSYIQ